MLTALVGGAERQVSPGTGCLNNGFGVDRLSFYMHWPFHGRCCLRVRKRRTFDGVSMPEMGTHARQLNFCGRAIGTLGQPPALLAARKRGYGEWWYYNCHPSSQQKRYSVHVVFFDSRATDSESPESFRYGGWETASRSHTARSSTTRLASSVFLSGEAFGIMRCLMCLLSCPD